MNKLIKGYHSIFMGSETNLEIGTSRSSHNVDRVSVDKKLTNFVNTAEVERSTHRIPTAYVRALQLAPSRRLKDCRVSAALVISERCETVPFVDDRGLK